VRHGSDGPDNRSYGGGEMTNYKVIIAILALTLAAGLFGGYRIWGTRDKGKVDLKETLRTLGQEIDRIERQNKDLVATIEGSKREVAASEAIRKENKELKDRLQNALQEKAALDNTMAQLRAKEIDAQKQAAVEKELRSTVDDLKGRIAAMESRNRELSDRVQKAERENTEKEGLLAQARDELAAAEAKASAGEQLQSTIDDLNARISALEDENRELKAVIDNISEMTQRRQEAR
jgi:chromosome segregation ATPase